MIRTFKLSSGMDLEMTLAIDTEIVLPEYANEIARFWISSEDVLASSDGDDYQATARYAASRLWGYLIDGLHEKGAVMELHQQEGWCWPGEAGIEIKDYEIPDFYPANHDVVEVSNG